ncbi:sensor domain-containing diguanylate cyclase [Petrocella sp. FN5]|uniref:sensor domain-containing diguanylate cyclase n=1 Tax=Petrocella sp. FN5 TaxID=3032002 RepID=UPI0023DA1F42|nr:sensor domain-containing diguanylate cyclase [Petrocella sp. FN5]MDF1617138.1 sensor domain-containing diguanylate cyclase [Petrocella sp. FN5]
MKENIDFKKMEWLKLITIAIIVTVPPSLLPSPYDWIMAFFLILIILFRFAHFNKREDLLAKQKLQELSTSSNDQVRMLRSQRIMLELSNTMIQVSGLKELMSIILNKAIEVIPKAKFGSILVMNCEGSLEFQAIVGFDDDLYNITLDPKESYQWQATGGHFSGPVIIEDLLKYSKDFINEDTYNSMKDIDALSLKSSLSAPILIDGQFYGSINIDSEENNMFDEQDVTLMAYFANQATIAITNHQLYEKLLHLSKYDGLTKVLNRPYFEELFENNLARSKRNGEKVTLVVIDLNNFKHINDQYGHSVGDHVLTTFAKRLSHLIRETDLLARYGGDEFIIVFFNSDYNQTMVKLKNIHQKVTDELIDLAPLDKKIYCSFSYGLGEFPKDGDSLKTLFYIADHRMYDMKPK